MDDTIIIDVLLTEYNEFREGIRERLDTSVKMLGWGISLLTIIFTIGFHYNVNEVFIITPVFILWFYSYLTYLYSEIFVFAGYVQNIERQINLLCQSSCLIYETYVANLIYKKGINVPTQFIGFLVSGSIVGICFYKIYEEYNFVFCPYLIIFSLSLIILLFFNMRMSGYKQKTINFIMDSINKDSSE